MSWLQRLFARKRMDIDLDKELRFHFDAQVADKVRSGISETEARRLTRIEFGGIDQIKEDCRERRGTLWVESIFQDVRYGLRQLRKSPGFTLTAVITLALGIGATTAIFTLIQAVLERSLPVADPSHLYRVGDQSTCCYYGAGFERDDGDFDLFPYDLYLNLKQSSPEFEQLAAVEAGGSSLSLRWGTSSAQPLRSEFVSGNYFTMLGVAAYAGRPLTENDDKAGAAPALVLSYAAWQSNFGGDPAIVGSTVHVQTLPFTVVGIAPPHFFGDRIVERPPDVWIPLSNEPAIQGAGTSLWPQGDDDTAWLYLLGRVRPQTSIPALQSKLSTELRQWMYAHSKFSANGGAALIPRQHVVLSPGGGGIQSLQQQTGQALAHADDPLHCRSSHRMFQFREPSARPWHFKTRRTIRAHGARRSPRQDHPPDPHPKRPAQPHGRSRGSRCRLCVFTDDSPAGLSACAQYADRRQPFADRSWFRIPGFSAHRRRLRNCARLVFLAGQSSRSFPHRQSKHRRPLVRSPESPGRCTGSIVGRIALGSVSDGSLACQPSSIRTSASPQPIAMSSASIRTGRATPSTRLPALYREIENRLSALPSAVNVSFARHTPLDGNVWGTCIVQQGHPKPGPGEKCFSSWVRVSSHFLQTVGVPIVRGRDFSRAGLANLNSCCARQSILRASFSFPTRIPSANISAWSLPKTPAHSRLPVSSPTSR